MKKSALIFLIIILVLTSIGVAYSQSVSREFVRFHIIADSNSPYDQLIKMKLRDYIFEVYKNELSSFETKEETLEFLRKNISEIKHLADSFLYKTGYKKEVKVDISESYYPKKHYSGFVLPYGEYSGLRITIGSGKGNNFFCVMFPPACLSEEMTDSIKEKLDSRKIIYKFKLF